ncbi:MAG: hypothetical protein HZB55_22150 [Deltaproteobacteria bacterium]|nr:hypothetical protein [Deltaproteobacteria bacterium]
MTTPKNHPVDLLAEASDLLSLAHDATTGPESWTDATLRGFQYLLQRVNVLVDEALEGVTCTPLEAPDEA